MIKEQGSPKIPGNFSVAIGIPEGGRRRDIDNYIKPILDVLVAARVTDDDGSCDFVSAKRVAIPEIETGRVRVDVAGKSFELVD